MLGPGILERLADLEREAGEVEARLGDPATFEDHARYVELNRRLKELAPIVAAARAYRDAQSDLAAAREMFGEAEGEDRDHLRAEIALAEGDVERLAVEIPVLLLPKDPDADRRVLLEIRGAEGGEEANLFARDLYEMYRAWAGRRGWTWEPVSTLTSELGGLTEATVLVGGEGAWSRLRHEAGPHRVQRVPVTESAGRVHTSSATVAVLPEAEEQEVAIDAGDLRVDVFRSSGAGGQHVNTTDSAVRITHLPTGLVVSVQDNRSQIQNRDRALQILRARLRQRARAEAADAEAGERRSQVGGGGRSEKVRTYNFKENRVTDHRIGLTLYSLDRVLMGELDGVSDALVADEQTRRLATGG